MPFQFSSPDPREENRIMAIFYRFEHRVNGRCPWAALSLADDASGGFDSSAMVPACGVGGGVCRSGAAVLDHDIDGAWAGTAGMGCARHIAGVLHCNDEHAGSRGADGGCDRVRSTAEVVGQCGVGGSYVHRRRGISVSPAAAGVRKFRGSAARSERVAALCESGGVCRVVAAVRPERPAKLEGCAVVDGLSGSLW